MARLLFRALRRAYALLFTALLLITTGCVISYETRRPPPTMVSEPVRRPIKEQPMRWWIGEARLFERGDGWTLPLVLDLGGQAPPDHPVRYRIDVALQVAYERVEDESGGPHVMRAVPVEGEHRVSIEEQVCFRSSPSDSGRYRIGVRLERNIGFQPGEYQVTLRGPDGSVVGTPRSVSLH